MTLTLEATETGIIDPCTICHKPKADHPYRHAWVGYSTGTSALFESTGNDSPASSSQSELPSSQGSTRVLPTGDPVLRIALLRKGILTLDDLASVEAELRGAGVAYFDPDSVG